MGSGFHVGVPESERTGRRRMAGLAAFALSAGWSVCCAGAPAVLAEAARAPDAVIFAAVACVLAAGQLALLAAAGGPVFVGALGGLCRAGAPPVVFVAGSWVMVLWADADPAGKVTALVIVALAGWAWLAHALGLVFPAVAGWWEMWLALAGLGGYAWLTGSGAAEGAAMYAAGAALLAVAGPVAAVWMWRVAERRAGR